MTQLDLHEITHMLSSQQDQSRSEGSEKGPNGPGIKSLTCCQINRIRVRLGIVRRDPVGSGIKSLTYCRANRTKVGSEDSEK